MHELTFFVKEADGSTLVATMRYTRSELMNFDL